MSPRKCEWLPGGLGRLRAGLSEEGRCGVTHVSLLSSGHFSPVELFNSRNSSGRWTDFFCSVWFQVFFEPSVRSCCCGSCRAAIYICDSCLQDLAGICATSPRAEVSSTVVWQRWRWKVAELQGTGHKLPSRVGTSPSGQESNFKLFLLFFLFFSCFSVNKD